MQHDCLNNNNDNNSKLFCQLLLRARRVQHQHTHVHLPGGMERNSMRDARLSRRARLLWPRRVQCNVKPSCLHELPARVDGSGLQHTVRAWIFQQQRHLCLRIWLGGCVLQHDFNNGSNNNSSSKLSWWCSQSLLRPRRVQHQHAHVHLPGGMERNSMRDTRLPR